MSKRVRGTRRTPSARAAARPGRGASLVGSRPANQLADPLAPNALAADATTAALPAPAALRGATTGPRAAPARASALAVRAATEYVYVGQDLRHIGLMAAVLSLILAILFVVIDVAHLIQL